MGQLPSFYQRGKAARRLRGRSLRDEDKKMKMERRAPVWRWFIAFIFVGVLIWRWGPVSFAGRQSTPKPRVTAADFGRWTSLGPSNFGRFASGALTGRVSAVAVDPGDPAHWLIGAALGGVWDTHDAGVTWQPRTDGQPSLAIGAIAFSPGSRTVVYAGTGEANFSDWGATAGAGMLRSTDSGVTWSVVNTGSFARASVKTIL